MKPTKNLWPLGIMLTFVLFTCVTISLVVMACYQKVDLVSGDYYEQEIKFQDHINQVERTRHLARTGSVAYDSATRRIRIALPIEVGAHLISGHIQLYRPSASGLDRLVNLEPDAQGVQFLDAASLQRGLWKVRVSWTVENQDYFLDQSIKVSAGV